MDYLYACLNENTVKPGSIYYYAYRHCEHNIAEILYALDQLKYQWFKASELYIEPYPSLHKLQWWQQAIENLGTQNHPLIKTLCKHFTSDELNEPLNHDLQYALTTIAHGRNYQGSLDLSHSFLGIATLKAKALGFKDENQIRIFNNLDELLRHLLLIGKHFFRHIFLDEAVKPGIDKQTFNQATQRILTKIKELKMQLNLPQQQIKPLILLHKQQSFCVKKYVRKVDDPFTQSMRISPLALLFSTIFRPKL